jgi:hypothetical protein
MLRLDNGQAKYIILSNYLSFIKKIYFVITCDCKCYTILLYRVKKLSDLSRSLNTLQLSDLVSVSIKRGERCVKQNKGRDVFHKEGKIMATVRSKEWSDPPVTKGDLHETDVFGDGLRFSVIPNFDTVRYITLVKRCQ